MKTIFVFLAEGFEEIEALTPVDVLRRAGLSVETVSVMEEQVVTGAHGVPVLADKMFADINPEDAEMILLPGGMPGATNLDAHEGLSQMVLDFAKEEKTLAAICAAPLVFGNRGLLQDKKATCYPGFETYLQGADYTAALVEKDSNFITAKGPGAALEFAFAIVEKYCGCQMGNELKHGMMIQA